jgi:glucokinase
MTHFIGIDLGGTHLRAGVVDARTGALTAVHKTQTLAREGPAAVIARMVALIAEVRAEVGPTTIGGVGIGAPGTVDIEGGIVRYLPNLPGHWRDVPLAALIQDQTGLPTWLLNDVRVTTLAEWKFGAGRGVDTAVCYAIGTGIGGGLVVGGQLVLNFSGSAGELGHTVVEPNGLPCICGGRGCLELYAAGPAIMSAAAKAVMHGHTTSIGRYVEYDLNRLTVETVEQAARDGDAIAARIFAAAGFYLGVSISNLIQTIGPGVVILGGGVARAGDLLLEPIWRTVRERVHMLSPTHLDSIRIVPAALGTNAGLIGAGVWAAERAHG